MRPHVKGPLAAAALSSVLATSSVGCHVGAQVEAAKIPVDGYVGALAVQDLNEDGHLDIVAARSDASSLVVHLGDRNGGFHEAPNSPFPAGDNPTDLSVTDFNGDGLLDVAVANHETDYVTVLLGDGKGGLQKGNNSTVTVPSLPHPHGVAAADFSGDACADIAIESRDENQVLVVEGDCEGNFSAEPKRYSVGKWPYYHLRSADLNHDRRSDIVVTNTDGSSVSVLLADAADGLKASKTIRIAEAPFAVAIGDVNADTHPDLIIAHRRGSMKQNDLDGLTVLLGDGQGEFSSMTPSLVGAGAAPTALATGDWNGDGIDDVAVANQGSNDVTVLLGAPAGLAEAEGSPFPVGQLPECIALADLKWRWESGYRNRKPRYRGSVCAPESVSTKLAITPTTGTSVSQFPSKNLTSIIKATRYLDVAFTDDTTDLVGGHDLSV